MGALPGQRRKLYSPKHHSSMESAKNLRILPTPASQSAVLPKVLLVVLTQVLADLLPQHLARTRRFQLVKVARDLAHLHNLISELQPDLLLIDFSTAKERNLLWVRQTKQRWPSLRAIAFNAPLEIVGFRSAIEAGCDGYLAADAPVTELIAALGKVQSGVAFYGASVSQMMEADYFRGVSQPQQIGSNFSPRERQIIDEIAAGYRTKEIASHLQMSHRTVDKHRQNIAKKTRKPVRRRKDVGR